jgi:hypothetical protein
VHINQATLDENFYIDTAGIPAGHSWYSNWTESEITILKQPEFQLST